MVDIRETHFASTDPSVFLTFEATDQVIINTPFDASQNNTVTVSELDALDLDLMGSTAPISAGIRGVNVDLVETADPDMIDIFLRPIQINTNTHNLIVEIDFDSDSGQVVESIQFNGGDLYRTIDPIENFVTTSISPDQTSITIEYLFPATSTNIGGQQTSSNLLTSFDSFTVNFIPEPSSVLLLGMSSLLLLRRKR